MRSARRPARASPAAPAGTAKPTETQSSPRAANAVLWSKGDSEWATGSPITPTTAVAAVGHRPSTGRSVGTYPTPRLRPSASLANCCW